MGIFLDAAYKVLQEANKPLGTVEITEKAISGGYLKTSGATPPQTMKSKISTNIRNHRNNSQFMRTAAGKFALREWEQYKEYYAPRFKKELFDEQILVFEKKHLSDFLSGEGFIEDDKGENSFVESLGKVVFSEKRLIAEDSLNLIQPISVFIVRYKNLYLTHKRTKRLPESRLHGFYSMILGGHLVPDDLMRLFNDLDVGREFKEELKLTYNPEMKYRGLLYDTSKEVSKIHLGIVFDVFLQSKKFEIGERGFLMDPRLETLGEIRNRIDDFENWSQKIALREGY